MLAQVVFFRRGSPSTIEQLRVMVKLLISVPQTKRATATNCCC